MSELGTFLRARRESVTPSSVGLPAGSRRRTPGLRRSELATLAGISVEYLTRLEQGRDRHPSTQVLAAVANALRLSYEDRIVLRNLSKVAGSVFCQVGAPPASTVRPAVRQLLDRLEPAPAYVMNRLGDVLAHTAAFGALAGTTGLLDDQRPNLVRFVFTDRRARRLFPDWEQVADGYATRLRDELRRGDAHVAHLVDELTVLAGAAFSERPAGPFPAALRLHHPDAGELRLVVETLQLSDADEQQLVVHLPADDATAAALDRLTGRRPGALRAVG